MPEFTHERVHVAFSLALSFFLREDSGSLSLPDELWATGGIWGREGESLSSVVHPMVSSSGSCG